MGFSPSWGEREGDGSYRHELDALNRMAAQDLPFEACSERDPADLSCSLRFVLPMLGVSPSMVAHLQQHSSSRLAKRWTGIRGDSFLGGAAFGVSADGPSLSCGRGNPSHAPAARDEPGKSQPPEAAAFSGVPAEPHGGYR